MEITEIVGFVTGALCVWLAVRQNVWTFPIGMLNNVAFGILFVKAGLYAGAGLQAVYLLLGALGCYWWLRGGTDRAHLSVHAVPRWGWLGIAVGTALSTLALYAALTTWTDSTVPAADALTTSLSLAAQLMMGRKWLGSWAVWITVDALFVVLYVNQGLWLTAVLYAGFIPLCVRGVYEWRRDMATQRVESIAASSGAAPGDAGAATGAVAAKTVHP